MGHSCRTLLWDTPVDTLAGHPCRKLLWILLYDTLVGHSCRTLLWDTLVGHSCRTLLWDTLVGHSCGTLLWTLSFNSGGLGVESCSRSVVSMFATVRNRSQPSATVRNRSQPSATVRSRTLRRCHWGKLLQVTFHGCVTCQFATLFHCDLHENDMSRKKRDAFRCTGAVV